MKSFLAFFKKEILENLRNKKILILTILFFVFGIMNPAITKLTPMLFDLLAEELAQSGMVIEQVTADALMSWMQFFKNIPMALIAFVFLYSGSFTKEFNSGTLILILTKGLARYKVVVAKSSVMLLLWTVGYWFCYLITYVINAVCWDNGIVQNLVTSAVYWWLFGVFVIALMILASVIFRNYGFVLLATGGSFFVLYLVGLIPKVGKYIPTALMNTTGLLVGAESCNEYLLIALITATASIIFIGISIPLLNKKEI